MECFKFRCFTLCIEIWRYHVCLHEHHIGRYNYNFYDEVVPIASKFFLMNSPPYNNAIQYKKKIYIVQHDVEKWRSPLYSLMPLYYLPTSLRELWDFVMGAYENPIFNDEVNFSDPLHFDWFNNIAKQSTPMLESLVGTEVLFILPQNQVNDAAVLLVSPSAWIPQTIKSALDKLFIWNKISVTETGWLYNKIRWQDFDHGAPKFPWFILIEPDRRSPISRFQTYSWHDISWMQDKLWNFLTKMLSTCIFHRPVYDKVLVKLIRAAIRSGDISAYSTLIHLTTVYQCSFWN